MATGASLRFSRFGEALSKGSDFAVKRRIHHADPLGK
jgi:hypothetical protein